jgi:Flp pilus assembly protein TadG
VLIARLRALSGRQRGQSLVEFALAMPVLVVLLVGSVALGRLAYQITIVNEAVDEATKIAMVDRLDSNGDHAQSMSNDDMIKWIRAAAAEGDKTIDPNSICPDGNWEFHHGTSDIISGIANKGSGFLNDFNNNAEKANSTGNLKNDKGGTVDTLERWLNPGLQSLRVTFKFRSGIGNRWDLTVPITRHYTSYQMFTVPFNAPSSGAVSASGC